MPYFLMQLETTFQVGISWLMVGFSSIIFALVMAGFDFANMVANGYLLITGIL